MFVRAVLFLAVSSLMASAQMLPFHSIKKPGEELTLLDTEWFFGGTAVPNAEKIVLTPGVTNRVGALWSKYPLLTNDFEVTVKIKASRPASRVSKDGGFAFWYTPENVSIVHEKLFINNAQNQQEIIANTWQAAFDKEGCDAFAYKSKYEGLGVFFLDEENPTISAIGNDGSRAFKVGSGIPTPDAMKVNFLSGAELVVKIQVKPDSAKIEVVGHGTLEVKQAFKSGGYMGLTVFGGSPNEGLGPKDAKGPIIEMLELQVENKDKNAKGEEARATAPPAAKGEAKDVVAEASNYKDHRAESDAIKDLTNMVFKLVVETQPIRHQMERAIASLAKRIDTMENNFQVLKTELDKKTGHKLGEEFEAIKKELTTLSNVASKETEERHSKLESLHNDIADVHKTAHSPDSIDKHLDKLSETNIKVLDQLTTEHQSMFGVSVVAIAFVVVAGLALYNKFRCWEKKHVL